MTREQVEAQIQAKGYASDADKRMLKEIAVKEFEDGFQKPNLSILRPIVDALYFEVKERPLQSFIWFVVLMAVAQLIGLAVR